MKILVNDTNILIDLHSVGLLEEMCRLPYEIHTVDFVWRKLQMPTSEEFLMDLLHEGKYPSMDSLLMK